MTRRPDLHHTLTGVRAAEGDTTVDRIRPDEAARLAEYHAPREPMPAWAGWVWIAVLIFGAATWAAIAWGIWG